jgi:hypothetical protein
MFYLTLSIGDGKGSSYDRHVPMQAQRGGRDIAPTHSRASTSKKWVVSIMPRPLYPQGRSITHRTGGWVGRGGQSGRAQKVLLPSGFSLQAIQPMINPLTPEFSFKF